MKKGRLAGIVLLSGILVFAGCKHEHVWEEATCESPKQCTKCGDTEGEKKEHLWKGANCTLPKTCERCGATEGDPLGHNFLSATCVRPEECGVCGETRGEIAAHTGEMVGRCKICDTDQNKSLVLTIGYRHEVVVERYRLVVASALQAMTDETNGIQEQLEQTESEDLETAMFCGYPLKTFTLGQYFTWADELLCKLLWEDQKEGYEEMKSVYEEVFALCGDYPELKPLKERTEELIGLVPLHAPESEEGKWDGYHQRFSELSSSEGDEEKLLEEAMEQWKAEMLKKLQAFSDFEAKIKKWEEEYAKVEALFE